MTWGDGGQERCITDAHLRVPALPYRNAPPLPNSLSWKGHHRPAACPAAHRHPPNPHEIDARSRIHALPDSRAPGQPSAGSATVRTPQGSAGPLHVRIDSIFRR